MSLTLVLLFWLVACASSLTAGLKRPDLARKKDYKWDDSGYVLYCPCMGRFGNQAAHFLGAMAFAKALNRTFVIPPWRSHRHQRNVPFTEFFRLDAILVYHRALLLEDFMDQLAPTYWPPGNRTGYCYAPSSRITDREDCEMKHGNPFGPFWNAFSVEFDGSEFTRMSYTINREIVLERWRSRYPASVHPIMAFKGAPASFPVLSDHRYLHKHLRWNPRMEAEAFQFIDNSFGANTNFIAIHLRMGSDWERACESAVGQHRFMESVQCLEGMPGALITQSLCLPTLEEVTRHLVTLTRKTRTYTVFVASDVPAENHGLQQWLGSKIKTYYLPPDFPQLDLAVMAKAQHFVGNCISSFSAFVKRERDFLQKSSDFFGLAEIKENYVPRQKTEL